jgi:hypothetical protein
MECRRFSGRRDAGRPERVITGLSLDAGDGRAPADHGAGVGLGHRPCGRLLTMGEEIRLDHMNRK